MPLYRCFIQNLIYYRQIQSYTVKMTQDTITIKGARTHNLKNIDLHIPRNKLTVITGVSGSGKSSLAFDTLYAEGQRRYVESLSAYARMFLSQMQKPDVDSIDGLSPAIAIEQKSTNHNPRSTVGTITEIYDYLRLLYARLGVPFCPTHDLPMLAQTPTQMQDDISKLEAGTKCMLLAPVISGRKGAHLQLMQDLLAQGFVRLRVDGVLIDTQDAPLPVLSKNHKHDIEVVVDRFVVRDTLPERLPQSLEMALKLGRGIAHLYNMDTGQMRILSEHHACPKCNLSLEVLEPKLFSFNNPYGACPTCDGLGLREHISEDLLILKDRSLNEGAIIGWDKKHAYYFGLLSSVCQALDIDMDTPFEALSEVHKRAILHGTSTLIAFEIQGVRGGTKTRHAPFEGVLPYLLRRYAQSQSQDTKDDIARFMAYTTCPDCQGVRLNANARAVRVDGVPIGEVIAMPIKEALHHYERLTLSGHQAYIAQKIVKEIIIRLGFLDKVGLDYLTLSRPAGTLSGGEAQRIRLASQIGAGLMGVMYVLDEPSIGLHQRDNDRLLSTLTHLRDLGNTVIVVEHDEDAIRLADFVVDIGPFAGVHGGAVVAAGTLDEVCANATSLTGQYLSGKKCIDIPKIRRTFKAKDALVLTGARGNNLKNLKVRIPLGIFTCVTGVSGSGKSTLINRTLMPLAAGALNGATRLAPAPYDKITGLDKLDKMVDIDQSPIGRTPRSNPATYTGVFTPIRELFAQVPAARALGYAAGRFSFNVKGGRCEVCQGDGVIRVEMHFLPDTYVTCETCHGARYNSDTLKIRYKDKHIADVLDMTVDEAHAFFSDVPAIKRRLFALHAVGLGYVRLGQAATTLSGGEAQRVKLARELAKRDTSKTLYILDEPTTGLHFEDIKKLLDILHALVDKGNSVLVIEHNLDVIKTADWVLDLGPEGGQGGGMLVAEGTPEALSKVEASHTGRFLRSILAK